MNEVNKIIRVVEETRFGTLPESWCCSDDYEAGIFGLVGPSADFLYYNIYIHHAITEWKA